MRLDSWPRAMAASMGGVPQAVDTAKKAVYIAPMCAAPVRWKEAGLRVVQVVNDENREGQVVRLGIYHKCHSGQALGSRNSKHL